MAAFLDHIGGGKVDRDAFGGQGKTDGMQGGTHAFAAFGHGLVRQTDNAESGQALGDLYLGIYVKHINALESDRLHALNHAKKIPKKQMPQKYDLVFVR
jgi:hypothetical protein